MNLYIALSLFNYEPHARYTEIELKAQFRKLCLIKHPDVGGNVKEFNELQDAYKELRSHSCIDEIDHSQFAVCGTPLSEFGKGYPLTESAKTCTSCKGIGYTQFASYKEHKEVPCPKCDGCGLVRYPCKRCNGSGKYTPKGASKPVGDCYGCKGSGWFYPINKRGGMSIFKRYIPGTNNIGVLCRECQGDGVVTQFITTEFAHAKCRICEGLGEIKMWNPVLPRGLFQG